uniref:hypothetical protein n=2 Tax=Pseudomonas aeruginosa TaxID=287 RepID=UPI001C4A36ED
MILKSELFALGVEGFHCIGYSSFTSWPLLPVEDVPNCRVDRLDAKRSTRQFDNLVLVADSTLTRTPTPRA